MSNKKENITVHGSVFAIEASEDIIALAKTRGIDLPHPALAVFSSILCEIEKPNANKVRLGRKATEEAVSTLIGTQVNFNHERRGNICGYIFDSRINSNNEVEISCVYFKHIYYSEFEEATDLFADGELTMSFELSADVESQDRLSDGTRRINDFYFTGAGLLLGETPACKNAIVYEFAKKELETVFAQKEPKIMKTIQTLYAKANSKLVQAFADVVEEKDITFALASKFDNADDEDKKLLTKDAQKWTTNYINNLNDAQEEIVTMDQKDIKEVKDEVIEEVVEEVVEEVKDEVIEEVVEEVKDEVIEEVKDEVIEEVVEEVIEDEAKTTYKTETETEVIEEYDEDSVMTLVKGEVKQTVINDEGEESVQTRQFENKEIYLFASVQKMTAKISELEATLEAKDSEIEEVRANAEKIGKLKVELADNEFVAEFTDEDYLDEAKIEQAKVSKANSIVISARKEELADNEFAVDFTDEDFMNDVKVENAKLKKELEVANANQKEEVAEVIEATEEDLDAGEQIVVSEDSALKRLMKNKSKN